MTILFASGEDSGFTAQGTAVGNTSVSSCARSGYARSTSTGIAVVNSTTVADPPANRFTTPTFTAGSTVWIHAQTFSATGTSTLNEQGLVVRSPDGVSRIVVRQTGTFGTIKVSSRSAAGTLTDLFTTSAGALVSSTITAFDLKISYIALGEVTLYMAGVSVGTFSGDPRTDAATQLNQVDFASLNNGSSLGSATVWSEVICADEDTRSMALWTLNPQAAGNTQSWTPNTLANINKGVINDATSISTASNNTLSQWTTPTSAPAGSWTVKAIVQEARIERGATGPQHFDWSLRIAGADFTAGTSNAPTTSFSNFGNQLWTTNPSNSSPWVIADIASGFNLGIESLA